MQGLGCTQIPCGYTTIYQKKERQVSDQTMYQKKEHNTRNRNRKQTKLALTYMFPSSFRCSHCSIIDCSLFPGPLLPLYLWLQTISSIEYAWPVNCTDPCLYSFICSLVRLIVLSFVYVDDPDVDIESFFGNGPRDSRSFFSFHAFHLQHSTTPIPVQVITIPNRIASMVSSITAPFGSSTGETKTVSPTRTDTRSTAPQCGND